MKNQIRTIIKSIIDAELNSGSDFAAEYKAAKAAGDSERVEALQLEFLAHAKRSLGVS